MNAQQPAARDLLFVYGTFRRGLERHGALRRAGARYVARASTSGELFDLGDFPGARKSAQADVRVVGEVYRLPNPAKSFAALDRIEGFDPAAPASSLFHRETAEVALENGELVTAWVYWLNRAMRPMRRISSGDYTRKVR